MKLRPFKRRTTDDTEREGGQLRAQRKQPKRGKTLSITPPEGVKLDLPLADIGQRAGAQLADFLVTFAGAAALIILLAMALGGRGSALVVAAALIMFFVRVPYYVVTELIWNGRTLAKRWLGLRVVSVDGRSLGAHQVVVRNLMKEVEFFTPLLVLMAGSSMSGWVFLATLIWCVVLLVVPWRSKLNQRLGDIIANTAVILDPKPLLFADLAARPSTDQGQVTDERFVFTTQHLDHYGRYELQVLEKFLRAKPGQQAAMRAERNQRVAEIVERIVAKTGYPESIARRDHLAFLESFYRAQRSHLEARKLFGDARDDKFYSLSQSDKSR